MMHSGFKVLRFSMQDVEESYNQTLEEAVAGIRISLKHSDTYAACIDYIVDSPFIDEELEIATSGDIFLSGDKFDYCNDREKNPFGDFILSILNNTRFWKSLTLFANQERIERDAIHPDSV